MRKQTVIAESNAPTTGDPDRDQQSGEILPTKIKKRYGSENMEKGYKKYRVPIGTGCGGYFEIDDVLH